MTIEEAKELLPIIQAFAEGKTLQYRVNNENNEWKDINNPAFNDLSSEYRIKPEPTYRSFKTKEECWNEMMKHQPFGWLRTKSRDDYAIIGSINDYTGVDITFATNENDSFTTEFLFEKYKFADGAPFGIKEE